MLIALISFLFLSRESPPQLLKILLQFVQIFLFGGVKSKLIVPWEPKTLYTGL